MPNQIRNLLIVALIAALVAVTCWKQSPGQGEPAKPAAVKWEYKTITVATSDPAPLNKEGADGWEVCAAFGKVSGGGGAISTTGYAILRRPKTGN